MLYTPNYNFAHVAAKFAGVDVKTTILHEDSEVKKLIHEEGSVPVFKDEHGTITGTTAIARYFARQAADKNLLGCDEFDEALVDEYMNLADLDIQSYWNSIMYLLTGRIPCESHHKLNFIIGELKKKLEDYNRILEGRDFLVGKSVTLTDIQLACYIAYPLSLAINPPFRNKVLNLMNWYYRVTAADGHFESVFGRIKLCTKVLAPPKPPKKVEQPKEQKKPKEEKKSDKPEVAPTKIDIDNFKRFILNSPNKVADLKKFITEEFERDNWSIWHLKYDIYKDEGAKLHVTSNLCGGFLDRAEACRRGAFGMHCVIGDEPNLEIEGVWMWRGLEIMPELLDHPTFEYYKTKKLNVDNPDDYKIIEDFWCKGVEEKITGKTCQRKSHI